MRLPVRLSKRRLASHKGSYGHVLVVAGSRSYVGAAYLCAEGALRCGAGLVTLAVPEGIYPIIASRLTEAIFLPLPQTAGGALAAKALPRLLAAARQASCLAIGPGLSRAAQTQRLVCHLVSRIDKPMVIDADGLNALAAKRDVLKSLRKKRAAVILTPHPGELARLTRQPVAAIQKARKKVAKDFALHYNVHLILKGFQTVVASAEGGLYVNRSGNPGMATAGSGDVLTGICAGLLAQGATGREAARCGAYLHGVAGDLAARDMTEMALVASDILLYLPAALRRARAR